MSILFVALVGLLLALVWLVLLVTTQFNPITISMGLLGMIYMMGRAGTQATR